jgi:hypothetical protein
MSRTAFPTAGASDHFWTRLIAFIDRALMGSARIAQRNGDLPHFGL